MSEGMTTAVDTAFKAIKSDVSGMMTTALPVALAIVGIGLAVTLGVKFFKKISSKSYSILPFGNIPGLSRKIVYFYFS